MRPPNTHIFFFVTGGPPRSTLFPYTTLFRSLPDRTGHPQDADHSGSALAARPNVVDARLAARSEEHTSELQSPVHLVCRLLLEKKNRRLGPGPRAGTTPRARIGPRRVAVTDF